MFVPDGYADTLEEALEMISPLSVLHIKVATGGRSSRIGTISGLSSRSDLIGL